MASDGPRLLAPVTADSRVVRRPGVSYSEVAGVPVLWEPRTRTLHELSPAAAALWGALDGRPLREVVGVLATEGTSASTLVGEVVEAVRRLRVLGVAEDSDEDDPAPVVEAGVPATSVRLRGTLVPAPGGAQLVLADVGSEREGEAPGGGPTVLVEVAALTVAPDPADAAIPEASRPLVGVTVSSTADSPEHVASPHSRVLAPVALLGHLMAAVPPAEGSHLMVLDALASVAERVPGALGEGYEL